MRPSPVSTVFRKVGQEWQAVAVIARYSGPWWWPGNQVIQELGPVGVAGGVFWSTSKAAGLHWVTRLLEEERNNPPFGCSLP